MNRNILRICRWWIWSLALVPGVSAQSSLELSWGSAVIDQRIIQEDGSAIDTGSVIIELGSFGSFIPTADNIDQWLDNWKVFDAITPSDTDSSDFVSSNTGDPTLARFAGSAHLIDGQFSDSEDAALQNPTATFGPGEQGYVFFRTSETIDSSSQLLLFTSNVDSDGLGLADSDWQFPTVDGSQTQFPLAWFVDQADTAVVGAINGGSGNGGDTGGGEFTDMSTDFVLRLHSVSVPEPGASMMCLLAVFLFLRRKR